MQKLFLGLFILLTSLYISKPAIDNAPLVVLELFTSQGCSSCPPADVLLERVEAEYADKVITLSYHVDYWNYIGWKDPFSSSVFSDKQRTYGNKFLSNSIYTPQVVVNGKTHFVGSDTNDMRSNLNTYIKEFPTNTVNLSNIKKEINTLTLNYAVNGETTNKKLRLIIAIKERTTKVNRGENRSRTLKNTNIVVKEKLIALDSKTGTAHLDIPNIVESNDELLVVALVASKNLDITGGTQIAL